MDQGARMLVMESRAVFHHTSANLFQNLVPVNWIELGDIQCLCNHHHHPYHDHDHVFQARFLGWQHSWSEQNN